jgi:hypothetical protein
MAAMRVFLCHDVDPTSQKDASILTQVSARLQEMGIEIVTYPDRPDSEDFLDFVQQHLPTCQWFLLLQTPGLASLPQVPQAVDMALDLADQKQIQGVLRVVATPEEDPETPPEWTTLPSFDTTYDPLRALEKLSLSLSATESLTIAPPPAPAVDISLTTGYDRPPVPPSRLVKFREAARNRYEDLLYAHKRAVVVVSLLLLAVLFGSILLAMALRSSPTRVQAQPPKSASVPIYGEVSFFSTNMAGTEMTSGIADGVRVTVQHLAPPASGDSYYAWLLPDVKNIEGLRILVGQFVPNQGKATLTYQDPNAANLLANESSLLITEESSSPQPSFPTPDLSKWRYFGAFPQTPNPQDSNHFSALDHLRHLLADDSMSDMMPLPGGLGVWLLQNLRLVFEWASDARGTGLPTNAVQVRSDVIKILDALDGAESVGKDVPQGTPLLVDPMVSRKPILTIDPKAMVPGYLLDIDTHLFGFSTSPGTTSTQQTLAGKISSELDVVQNVLQQVRQDAKQLVAKTDKDLLSPKTVPLLDDLVNQAMIAYNGQQGSNSNTTQAGVTSIFVQIQQLAQFSIVKYTNQMQVYSGGGKD